MRSENARAVVFDLDDTLYLERGFVTSGFSAVQERLVSLGHPPANYAQTFLTLIEQNGSGKVFDDALAAHGIRPNPALIGDLVHTYRHHTPSLEPQPGVVTLLERLSGQGVRLGVITDGAVSIQRGKLTALGLTSYFHTILATDALGPERVGWKPSTLPFITLEESLGLSGAALTYVGDNPTKDFIGAQARGWACARLRVPGQLHTRLKTPEGVAEVDSVAELQALLCGPEALSPGGRISA